MSAFMHDSAHVDALVHAALRFPRHALTWTIPGDDVESPVIPGLMIRPFRSLNAFDREAATRIGRILLRENAESMAYRYNMKDLDNEADDGTRPIEYLSYLSQADGYDYNDAEAGITPMPWRFLPAVAILKALSSYEYQSCEHPEWATSEAKSFCDALRDALIGALPGYQDADTWTISAGVPA